MDLFRNTSRKDYVRLTYQESLWSPAEIYHENSKMCRATMRSYRTHIQRVTGQPYFLRHMAQSYKTYPTAEHIALPEPGEESSPPIESVIRARRSIRTYAGGTVTLQQMSKLLFYSYGITGSWPLLPDLNQKLRATPSGGALYPLELYVAAFRVEGLNQGLFHYNVLTHGLELVRPGDHLVTLGDFFFAEEILSQSAALFLITALFKRTAFKYRERGYRFVLMEVGHLAQNLWLLATAQKLGCVSLGGFLDDEVNQFLDVDGVDEAALYALAVGTLPV